MPHLTISLRVLPVEVILSLGFRLAYLLLRGA